MLILNDKTADTSKATFEEQMPQDPPPTYSSVQAGSASPAPGPSSTPPKAVNYVSISRKHGHIKETFTIDPSLHILESFPLGEGETESSRNNVKLESVHGHVEAEITLLQNQATLEAQGPQRATLILASTHGGIKATIPDHPHRPPFLLTGRSRDGGVRLTLPRSFTGPITVSYEHGDVKASALGEHFITITEVNGKMKGFIGDLSKYTEYNGVGKGWKGDELVLDVKHGSVKLKFYQDGDTSSPKDPTSPRKSIFSKIFGL